MPANAAAAIALNANGINVGDWRCALSNTCPLPHPRKRKSRDLRRSDASPACSIEEDKLLEGALAEHWELDNRSATLTRDRDKAHWTESGTLPKLCHSRGLQEAARAMFKFLFTCRVDKIALKLPRKSKEAVKHRIHLLEVCTLRSFCAEQLLDIQQGFVCSMPECHHCVSHCLGNATGGCEEY